jgi:hypothetical protein
VPPVAEIAVEGYDRTVYLPTTTQRGQIIARVVDLLVQKQLNIYFEIDGDQVIDVAIPIVDAVRDLIDSPSGDVLVVLDRCPTPLEVRCSNIDREWILKTLARAAIDRDTDRARETVAVVTRFPFNEVDFAQVVTAPAEECQTCSDGHESAFSESHLGGATVADLDAFVVEQAQSACSVKWPSPGCVPHTYVVTYCWLRAHEMCLRLQARGLQPGKVWLFSRSQEETMRVPTALLPGCMTNWLYHVVAIVPSTDGGMRVIDPSLFPGGTVSEADYLTYLDPDPTGIEHQPMTAYTKRRGKPANGATPLRLEQDRAYAVAALVATLKDPDGPPPYCVCHIDRR